MADGKPAPVELNKSVFVRNEDDHQEKYVYLPDTMAEWPWPRKISPYYGEVTAESDAWFKSLKPFIPDSQQALDQGDFGRLASLVYPDVSRGSSFLLYEVVSNLLSLP